MDSNIKNIELKEHVRKRPEMYIGSTGTKGLIYLLRGILDDSIEVCKSDLSFIKLELNPDNNFSFTITSLSPISKLLETLRPDYKEFKNFHLKVLQAISISLKINENDTKNQLEIVFSLDLKILPKLANVDYQILMEDFAEYALLNRHLEILLIDKTKKHLNQNYYNYKEGIFYLYHRERDSVIGKPYFEIKFDDTINGFDFQIALAYRTDWYPKPSITSFANNTKTICGGSLVDGIIEGLISGCEDYVELNSLEKYTIKDTKFANGLIIFCHVKGSDFKYGGSFKETLEEDEICHIAKSTIQKLTLDFLTTNKEAAEKFLWRFDESQFTHSMMEDR